MQVKKSSVSILLWLMWIAEGIVVGFGAILPGISGGTLCVAFGMYRPMIETISDIKVGMKKHGIMLAIFLLGVAVGFVGLSGLAAVMMEQNTTLVTCAFIGFIIGTMPELWRDAAAKGRGKGSYISMFVSFVVMLAILMLLKTRLTVTVDPGIYGYILCGLLWGLSFIVPGLSSSSLLLFFGLYKPMLEGISHIDMTVLIPMGIGMAACVLLLSKAVGLMYEKFYSAVSHGVIGIVAATALMILPTPEANLAGNLLNVFAIAAGGALSYFFTRLCAKLKSKTEKTE